MSVDEHHDQAAEGPFRFAILVISSSRTLDDDRSGRQIAALLEEAGHEVFDRVLVPDDRDAIRRAVTEATDAQVVISTGGTGLSPSDRTPEAVRPLFARSIDGFGELFRLFSLEQVGSAAMLSRATAGILRDGRVVFALPGSVAACELALERLILPEVGHLLSLVGPSPEGEDLPEAEVEWMPEEGGELAVLDEDQPTEEEAPFEAGPSVFQLQADGAGDAPEEQTDGPWRRGIAELGGEILFGEREPLPMSIEKLAPVVNVLHSAGETAVLKLGGGERFSLWGWPDLRRPGSKVLAVGWGDPLVEVLALHRSPNPTGTCIEGDFGQLTSADASVAQTCEQITGRAPPDTSGQLFAISTDTVWILRGTRVIRWDGRRERDDGNSKQVLATLMMDWHAR